MDIKNLSEMIEIKSSAIQAEQKELADRVFGLEQAHANSKGFGATSIEANDIGAEFAKHFERDTFARTGSSGKIEIKAAALTTATVGTTASPQSGAIYTYKPRLIDLFKNVAFNASTASYARVISIDNQAAQVAELAQKPQSGITAEKISADIPTYAHWIQSSLQAVEDSTALQGLINSVLVSGLARKITSLINPGNDIAISAPTGANLADSILYGAAALEDLGRTANFACLNTLDAVALMTSKNANGDYIFDAAQDSLKRYGLTVVTGGSIPQGQVLVGDSSAGQILNRQSIGIEMSRENGTNFTTNQVTILGEARMLLALYDANAFVSVSAPAAKAK